MSSLARGSPGRALIRALLLAAVASPRVAAASAGPAGPASPASQFARHRLLPAELDRLVAGAFPALEGGRRPPAGPAGPRPIPGGPPEVAPEAWLRRACLDLTGTVPDAALLSRIRTDASPVARARLVAALLASERFTRRWARLLCQPLASHEREHEPLRHRLEDHFRDGLARREGYDRIVRALLTAEGSPDESPGTAFFLQLGELRTDVAARLGAGLMGVRLACAQCHDHPFARWTMADYYGLAAWFARVRTVTLPRDLYRAYSEGRRGLLSQIDLVLPAGAKATDMTAARLRAFGEALAVLNRHAIGGAPPRPAGRGAVQVELHASGASTAAPPARRLAPAGDSSSMVMRAADMRQTVSVVLEEGSGELSVPESIAVPDGAGVLVRSLSPRARAVPRFPGTALPPPAVARTQRRREALADWLTEPGNPYLASALANRAWAHLFGAPLLESLDDLDGPGTGGTAPKAPPRPSGAPGAAADRRAGTRPEAASGPFGPASARLQLLAGLAGHLEASAYDLAGLLERLVLTRAYSSAPKVPGSPVLVRPLDADQVEGSLATALALQSTGAIERALARHFQPPNADDASEAAGAAAGEVRGAPLGRALFLLNGPELHRALASSPFLERLGRRPPPERLAGLFEALLARAPSAAERAALEPLVAGGEDRARLADVAWAVCVGAEFLTNH
jgi:hypothetical protein